MITRFYRKTFSLQDTGNSIQIKAELTTTNTSVSPSLCAASIDVWFNSYTNAILIENDFSANSRGFTGLANVYVDTDDDGGIKLDDLGQQGTVQSTVRELSTDITKITSERGSSISGDLIKLKGGKGETLTAGYDKLTGVFELSVRDKNGNIIA